MSSYNEGKVEVRDFLRSSFEWGSTVLDVGACDGKWATLLKGNGRTDNHINHFIFDAVEVFEPNIIAHKLDWKYRRVFHADIRELSYTYYDLIIFGDVLEHMSVEDSQNVVEYARDHASMILIAVPFLCKQDMIYDNPYEIHVQDDLTHEIVMERFPGFVPLWVNERYGYYYWKET